MDKNDYWLKFVLSGKPQDYINYVNKRDMEEGARFEDSDRRISNKRGENGRSRPTDNSSYKG